MLLRLEDVSLSAYNMGQHELCNRQLYSVCAMPMLSPVESLGCP